MRCFTPSRSRHSRPDAPSPLEMSEVRAELRATILERDLATERATANLKDLERTTAELEMSQRREREMAERVERLEAALGELEQHAQVS